MRTNVIIPLQFRSTADQYRVCARECVHWAEQVWDDEVARATWLSMADRWRQMADETEHLLSNARRERRIDSDL